MCCCCFACCACCAVSGAGGMNKALEIGLIILNSLSIILLLLCLIFISWSKLTKACLVLFIIMLIMTVGKLIMASFLRYWTSAGLNKTTRKSSVFGLTIFGVVLCALNFIICIIAESVTTKAFIKVNFPCYDSLTKLQYKECNLDEDFKIDIISIGQYFLAYITFSYLELALIGKGALFIVIRVKLENETRVIMGGPGARPQQAVVYPQNSVVIMQQPAQAVYPYQYQQQPYQQQYQYNQQAVSVQQQPYGATPISSNEPLQKKV